MTTIFCVRPRGFNVGNDAIFVATQHFIYKAFGDVVNLVTIPATSRFETEANAGLTTSTIHEINQYGDGVIVGGGNIYENGQLEVDLAALDALEVPLMLYSLSRGKIYNRNRLLVDRTDAMPDATIVALNRSAQQSLTRDIATKNHLDAIGCENTLGACPTIFLEQSAARFAPLPASDPGALVSIRTPNLMNIPLPSKARVHRDIENIVGLLTKKGFQKVRLLCHDRRDISFAASFENIEFVYPGDVYSYLALLRAAPLVVSYRVHSVLPSLSFGTPTIKISYDERGASLMKTIGLGGWDIDMVKNIDVVEQVEERYSRLNDLQDLVAQSKDLWEGYYQTNLAAFETFASHISSRTK